MTGKWIALGLIVLGLMLFAAAYKLNQTAAFEDGEFITMIICIVAGLLSCLVGGIWLLVLIFMAL